LCPFLTLSVRNGDKISLLNHCIERFSDHKIKVSSSIVANPVAPYHGKPENLVDDKYLIIILKILETNYL